MKVPKARKLPSGSWFCRVRVRGQDISITRSTKKEAVAEAMAIKSGLKAAARQESYKQRNRTVGQAVNDYIKVRENVLSPSTINGYHAIRRTRFQEAMGLRICDISAVKWQQIVNAEARRCSAKTLKNAWGLISSVIRETTGNTILVRLPQVVEKDGSFLTPEQIYIFLNAVHGKTFEIPALLGLSSLRRSEILALHWENIDFDNNLIRIEGAAVIGDRNQLVQKTTNKNASSRRIVPLIPPLKEAMLKCANPTGLVVTTSPTTLYSQINKLCRENNLPEIGVHGLRRTFASLAYHLGVDEEVTMKIGGWRNLYTMRRIYTKLSALHISVQADKLNTFFLTPPTYFGNENGNEQKWTL